MLQSTIPTKKVGPTINHTTYNSKKVKITFKQYGNVILASARSLDLEAANDRVVRNIIIAEVEKLDGFSKVGLDPIADTTSEPNKPDSKGNYKTTTYCRTYRLTSLERK